MYLSDLLISYLKLFGVEYVFGVPGGAIAPFYDALARSEKKGDGGPRAIVARQESGAAFMADGYARETGKIGVCCATAGPGTTNMITGIASAYVDHIPVLAVTGQTAISNIGRGSSQESSRDTIDTVGMLKSCTLYSTMVSHPQQFESKLATAFTTALQPPQGPVHLSVPLDVFRCPANEQVAFPNLAQLLVEPSSVDSIAIDKLCQKLNMVLNNHRKAVILVGYDGRNAVREIVEFAELIGANIVTTPNGKSCGFDFYHPLMQGVWGFAGHDSALRALVDDDIDLILAIGTSLDEVSTGSWDPHILMNDKLVHIQNSPLYFTRSPMASLQICGNIKLTIKELTTRIKITSIGKTLLQQVTSNHSLEPTSNVKEQRDNYSRCMPNQIEVNTPEFYRRQLNVLPPIKAQRLMCDLVQRFPPETRFLADVGNSFAWAIHYLFPNKGGVCRLSMGLTSMGWAIGASLGTFLGRPKGPVVCITGDGSYLMNGQEFVVAIAHKLTVVFVILNDHAFGMVKHGQILTGSESIGVQIHPLNFCKIAKTMGANGHIIRNVDDINKIDFEAIGTPSYGPTLFDVRVDKDEIPPMGMRVKELKSAKSPYSFKRRAEDIKKSEETRLAKAKLQAVDWNGDHFYSKKRNGKAD